MNQEKKMDFTIQIEEAALTAIAIYFLSRHNLGLPVWAWALLFFSPDVSALGYLISPRFGAFTYNLFHHRTIALVIFVLGSLINQPVLTTIGILLFAHSSFDRLLGYGLKYPDNFKHTSLGGAAITNS